MDSVTVYGLIDPVAPEHIRYVGVAKNVSRRMIFHRHDARKGLHTHKACWIRSIAPRSPRFVVLETEETASDAFLSERIYVMTMRAVGCRLTNSTPGGDGVLVHTAESLEKIGRATRGKKLTAEHKQKVSASLVGRPVSGETRAKIGAGNRGKVRNITSETKARMAASQKRRYQSMSAAGRIAAASHASRARIGSKHSPEARARMSAKLAGKIRRPHSSQTRDKISAALTGKKLGPQTQELIERRRQGVLAYWVRKRAAAASIDNLAHGF